MKFAFLLTIAIAWTMLIAHNASADPAIDDALVVMEGSFIDLCVTFSDREPVADCISTARESIRYLGTVISPVDTHQGLRILAMEAVTECAGKMMKLDAEMPTATGSIAFGILTSCVTTYYNNVIKTAGGREKFKAIMDKVIADAAKSEDIEI